MGRPLVNIDRLAKALSRMPAAIADAAILRGRVFGVGGDTWTVRAPLGDGLSSPAELGIAGTWIGYVYRETEPAAQQSAAGTPVSGAEWLAVGGTATYQSTRTASGIASLEAGMTLTSVANPTRSFHLVAPDPVEGYAQYQVRPQ